MLITLDGRSALGKTTAIRLLTKELKIPSFSSGLLYRYATATHIALSDSADGTDNLRRHVLAALREIDPWSLNSPGIREKLRTGAINAKINEISAIPEIRNLINKRLREMVDAGDLILDGRDCAAIFPDADIKLLLSAPVAYRASLALEVYPGHSLAEIETLLKDNDNAEPFFTSPREVDYTVDVESSSPRETTKRLLGHISRFRSRAQSLWDVNYTGTLRGLCFVEDPEEAMRTRTNGRLLVFAQPFDMYSHESLIFLETFTPWVALSDPLLGLDAETTLRIRVRNGVGSVFNDPVAGTEVSLEVSYPNPPTHAFCSNVKGLVFLKENGAKTVHLRAEWLLAESNLEGSVLTDFIEGLCSSFSRVFFRLFDNSDIYAPDPTDSTRGIGYIRKHKDFYRQQIEMIGGIFDRHKNIVIEVPYLRDHLELNEATKLIREHYDGEVAPMLEIPLMIGSFDSIAADHRTFVVGVGDLYELVGAFSRSAIRNVNMLEAFVVGLFEKFVFPYAGPEHTFYVSSPTLYQKMTNSPHRCKIERVAKY